MNRVAELRFEKSLNFGEPRIVEKGDLQKQAVALLLLCSIGHKGSVKAAVAWYQWQCEESVV